MPAATRFTTKPIRTLFQEEVSRLGGTVRDSFDDGSRLFTRAVLNDFRPVALGDDVQAGVALRADEEQICIHPYVFRLVCKNGAIWAHALETVRIEAPCTVPAMELTADIAEAIRACGAPAAFESAAGEMQAATESGVDMALQIASMFSQVKSPKAAGLLNLILGEYEKGEDISRFGLMNAITAVARDTDDPDMQWRLEELGGGVPAGRIPPIFEVGNFLSLREAYSRSMIDGPADLTWQMEEQFELVGASR